MVLGNLQEVPRLFETRRLFRREMAAGAYRLGPLWVSHSLTYYFVRSFVRSFVRFDLRFPSHHASKICSLICRNLLH